MATPEPVILGVDPSLSGTGFSIVSGDALLAYGTIRTAPDDGNDAERNSIIIAGLLTAVKECPERVTLMGVETQFFGVPKRAPRQDDQAWRKAIAARAGQAMRVSAVRGAISTLGPMLSIPVVDVSPAEAKRALTGNGQASKKQMQAAVLRDFGVSLAQDAADACGIAKSAREIVAGRTPARKQAHQQKPRAEATDGLPDRVRKAIERGEKK